MNPIYIDATDEAPNVKLDAINGIFEISGRSVITNVIAFYNPILNWLDEYLKSPNEKTCFKFKMDYFNTASSKCILDIILKIEVISKISDVTIRWHYQSNDDDMMEAGKEYADIVDVNIVLVENDGHEHDEHENEMSSQSSESGQDNPENTSKTSGKTNRFKRILDKFVAK